MVNNLGKERVFIIAEAGVNHNGDIELAKKLVDIAVDANADAVKFQTFKTERLVTKYAPKAEYQKVTTNKEESQFDMLKRLELPEKYHFELMNYCESKGIMFLSTPFDIESADFLESLGVAAYKISSGDLTNMPMLMHIARKGKPIILSTGMSEPREVEEAVYWLRQACGAQRACEIILLHCTTEYPTPYNNVNLKAIDTLRQSFKLPVGYSDHTLGIEVPIAAVAMGACIIEKHFTLDKNMDGPDHKASLEPLELKNMIRAIRNIEIALGDGVKKPSAKEIDNMKAARKSVIAAKEILKGCKLDNSCLTVKRPGTGIEPKYLAVLTQGIAKRDISIDEQINWDDIDMEVKM